jgi:hypothetical protein
MAAKKAPAKKMAAPKKADPKKPDPKKPDGGTYMVVNGKKVYITEAQLKSMAKANRNRTDSFGQSGFGETKAGVTAKDMAKANKGLMWWERSQATRTDARGNVLESRSNYDASTQKRLAREQEARRMARQTPAKKKK